MVKESWSCCSKLKRMSLPSISRVETTSVILNLAFCSLAFPVCCCPIKMEGAYYGNISSTQGQSF